MAYPTRRHPVSFTVLYLTAGFLLVSCAPATGQSESKPGGPGGTGVVTAAPPSGIEAVDRDTACAVAAQSPTLRELGGVGEPADTDLIIALSYCNVTLTAPGYGSESISVEVLKATDVALTAGLDPASFPGTFVLLPELGEHGQFTSLTPGVDPMADPKAGAISSARDDLGVTIAWATLGPILTFSQYQQIVLELLESLP